MPRLSDDSKFEFRASKNSVAAEFQSMVCNTASTTKSRLHLHASSQNFFCPFSRKHLPFVWTSCTPREFSIFLNFHCSSEFLAEDLRDCRTSKVANTMCVTRLFSAFLHHFTFFLSLSTLSTRPVKANSFRQSDAHELYGHSLWTYTVYAHKIMSLISLWTVMNLFSRWTPLVSVSNMAWQERLNKLVDWGHLILHLVLFRYIFRLSISCQFVW